MSSNRNGNLEKLFSTRTWVGSSTANLTVNLTVSTVATAVSRIDNLEFLADVIPKTTTYKQFKEKRAKESGKDLEIEKGQRTLNGSLPPVAETEKDSPSETKEASVPRGSRPPTVMMLVDGPGDSQAKDDGDVEMADR